MGKKNLIFYPFAENRNKNGEELAILSHKTWK